MRHHTLSFQIYSRLIQSRYPRGSSAGVTLIEVLVVLALTTMLAAFAAPALTSGTSPLRDTSRRLSGSFKLARARAMAETSAVRIRPRNRTQFLMERATRCSEPDENWTNITDRTRKDGRWVYEDLGFDSPTRLIRADVDGSRLANPRDWHVCFNSRGIADKTVELTLRNTDTNKRRKMTVFRGGTVDLGDIY